MKKLIVIFCILFLSTSQIYSQLFTEDFDYPVVTILSTTPPWSAVPLSGLLPILVDVPGGLFFPAYSGSGMGNAATLLPGLPIVGSEDDVASLSSSQTSGSVYSSFMLSMITAQTTGDYFFAMRTSGGAQVCRLYARPDGILGYNLGIEKSNGAGVVYAPATYLPLVTYLVIVKYTFVAGAGNDQMSLFVFNPLSPPPSTEPTPTFGPVTFPLGTDAANLSEVMLRQGGQTTGATLIIDGIIADNNYNNTLLPVELASFSSAVSGRNVELNWTTTSETNNAGFDIERLDPNSSISNGWKKISNVAGNGTSNVSNNYSFSDRNLATGIYQYRLKQTDFNGNFEYFNLSNEVNIGVPAKFELSQNYPNPFNPSTTINFDIPIDGNVSLKIFDLSGKEVATLINTAMNAGYYTVGYNASALSSGTYFYRISAEGNGQNFVSTKKMTLVK